MKKQIKRKGGGKKCLRQPRHGGLRFSGGGYGWSPN